MYGRGDIKYALLLRLHNSKNSQNISSMLAAGGWGRGVEQHTFFSIYSEYRVCASVLPNYSSRVLSLPKCSKIFRGSALTHPFIHSFVHSWMCPLLVNACMHACCHAFTHSVLHSSTDSRIHPFIFFCCFVGNHFRFTPLFVLRN